VDSRLRGNDNRPSGVKRMTIELAKEQLKRSFGFNEFRPMQEDIVRSVIDGKDCLVVMPTGSGKSLCYQLPATVLPGVTIVVSPLIALMKDQVEGLVANGISAGYINSSLDDAEAVDVANAVKNGELKMLYVSPEKLMTYSFQQFLSTVTLSLFAIDEAHCISSWGHDFRPEYTQLKRLKERFPHIPIVALTATADKLTRKDILSQLSLKEPSVYISSFDRPNLQLTVLPAQKRKDRIIEFVKKRKNESGIIYCLSRKQTEKMAEALRDAHIPARHYHAGMDPHERSKTQEDFIYGRVPIICATIAFGMGIDKSNVRYVIHYNLPKNIEGYYQEIGRAGRDGLPSETLLFYSLGDVVMLKKFARESGQPDLQLAKLERMQQFADALICRRKILLTYFGEQVTTECGNCDVCHNPPELFDGTRTAQMALSAIYRLKQDVAINTVIDVLRGSLRQDVVEQGFDKIKTHGAGKDISFEHWQQYMLQMLNMGLIDVAYDQHYALKITPTGAEVLNGTKEIKFVSLAYMEARAVEELATNRTTSKRDRAENELFERLRELRMSLSKKAKIPPYLVFTDATLDEMCTRMPANERDMLQVTGVGDKKFAMYGTEFIRAITDFITERDKAGEKIQGTTQDITFAYYNQGMPVAQIARERNLQEETIYSHLAELYEKGYAIDITQFLPKSELKTLLTYLNEHGVPEKLKTLYDHFQGKYAYHQLKLAVAEWRVKFGERGVVRYE